MSLNDWNTYSTVSPQNLEVQIVPSRDNPERKCLNVIGVTGELYLVPREQENTNRGQISGCFRTVYLTDDLPGDSEIRIYCMLSQEDIRESGHVYVTCLQGTRRVSLLKYTEGLCSYPESLVSLRLPKIPPKAIFGLMWGQSDAFEGVLFRGILGLDVTMPEKMVRLFDYLDTNEPLLDTVAEGFGVCINEPEFTSVCFEKTALHSIEFADPSAK